MVDSYSQSASVGSESEIETGPAGGPRWWLCRCAAFLLEIQAFSASRS